MSPARDAIIGHALKDVADAWLAAPSPAAAEAMVLMTDVMLAIPGGLFHSFVALMLGLPYLLLLRGRTKPPYSSGYLWLAAMGVLMWRRSRFAT